MSNHDLSTSVDDLNSVIAAIGQALNVSSYVKELSSGLDELVEANDSQPIERFYDIQGEQLNEMTSWLSRLEDAQQALIIQRDKLEETEAMTI